MLHAAPHSRDQDLMHGLFAIGGAGKPYPSCFREEVRPELPWPNGPLLPQGHVPPGDVDFGAAGHAVCMGDFGCGELRKLHKPKQDVPYLLQPGPAQMHKKATRAAMLDVSALASQPRRSSENGHLFFRHRPLGLDDLTSRGGVDHRAVVSSFQPQEGPQNVPRKVPKSDATKATVAAVVAPDDDPLPDADKQDTEKAEAEEVEAEQSQKAAEEEDAPTEMDETGDEDSSTNDDEQQDPSLLAAQAFANDHGIRRKGLLVWKCIPMRELPPHGPQMAKRLGAASVGTVMLRAPTEEDPYKVRKAYVVPTQPPTYNPDIVKKAPRSASRRERRTIVQTPSGSEYWITTLNKSAVQGELEDAKLDVKDPKFDPVRQSFGYQFACQKGGPQPVPRRIRADASGLIAMPDLSKEANDFLFNEVQRS